MYIEQLEPVEFRSSGGASVSMKPALGTGATGPQGLPGTGSAAFQAFHAYGVGDVVLHTDGSWLRAITAHTSGASIDLTKFEVVATSASTVSGTALTAKIAADVPGAVPVATTTTQGKVELATTAETTTGTDATRAVTPAGAKASFARLDSVPINVKAYGVVADGVTDDSAAWDAAAAANPGRVLFLPNGTSLYAAAHRLVLTGYGAGLQGNPSGLTSILKFTDAAGGLDVGDGTTIIQEPKFNNLIVQGNNTATTVVRFRKVYQPWVLNWWIDAGADTLIEFADCGQLDADRFTLSNAPIGMKFTGTVSPVMVGRLCQFYGLGEGVRVSGTSMSKVQLQGIWEAVDALVTFNTASSVSIGELILSGRVLKANGTAGRDGNQRILKAVAGTVNSQVVDLSGLYIAALTSTVPLVDFTAVDNSAAAFNLRWRNSHVEWAGTAAVQVHASQNSAVFVVDMADIQGLTLDKYATAANLYTTGGVWPRPANLWGSGSPEGVVTAFKGSTYQNIQAALGANAGLWVKAGGNGNTGWRPTHILALVTTKTANYTATVTDDIIVCNGASVTITLPSPGNSGTQITVKNINAAAATVQVSGGTTIDGAASVSLAQWAKATFVSNGTNWFTV